MAKISFDFGDTGYSLDNVEVQGHSEVPVYAADDGVTLLYIQHTLTVKQLPKNGVGAIKEKMAKVNPFANHPYLSDHPYLGEMPKPPTGQWKPAGAVSLWRIC